MSDGKFSKLLTPPKEVYIEEALQATMDCIRFRELWKRFHGTYAGVTKSRKWKVLRREQKNLADQMRKVCT